MRVIAGFVLLILPISTALSEGAHDFFNDQNPREIFSNQVSDPLDSGIYLLREISIAEPITSPDELSESAPERPEASVPTSREEIIKSFGSPEELEPIKAIDDAPRPFKGMMAAIQIGDERLAWEYARKYTRYVKDVQDATGKAVGLQAKAMEIEGVVDGEGWTGSERFKKYDKYLNQDLAIEDRAKIEGEDQGSLLVHLPAQLQSEITHREHFKESESQDLLKNEEALRVQTRAILSRRIPGNRAAKLEILFFLTPGQSDSLLMGREMESIHKLATEHDQINFVAVSNTDLIPSKIKRFKYSAKATYPVMPYLAFSEVVELPRSTPALVFISSANREVIVEQGLRKAFYVKELINIMLGGAGE